MKALNVFLLITLMAFAYSATDAVADCKAYDNECNVKRLLGRSHSEWKGNVYAVVRGVYSRSPVTVKFQPVTNNSGSWISAPFNLCSPGDQLYFPDGQGDYTQSGTWTGKYKIVGDAILTYEIRRPDNVDPNFGRSCQIHSTGETLRLLETRGDPNSVIELRRK